MNESPVKTSSSSRVSRTPSRDSNSSIFLHKLDEATFRVTFGNNAQSVALARLNRVSKKTKYFDSADWALQVKGNQQ